MHFGSLELSRHGEKKIISGEQRKSGASHICIFFFIFIPFISRSSKYSLQQQLSNTLNLLPSLAARGKVLYQYKLISM
jgi:hypothetical protein